MVENFIIENNQNAVKLRIIPINDKFGDILTSNCDCLVVTPDTLINGIEINQIRCPEKSQVHLEIFEPKFDNDPRIIISSTARRISLLGMYLREKVMPNKFDPALRIVGLTGMAASGKSVVCKYLRVIFLFLN